MSDRRIEWLVCGGLAATVITIFAAVVFFPARAKPPPVYGALPDFTLIDQDNHPTTLATLRGEVCIADVIFTRCAGQCLTMSASMKEIQAALPAPLPIKLVSITTDPAYDTPAVLKKYGARYDAQDGRWLFLTGDKAALHHATVDGLKLAAVEKTPGEQENANDLFIHSTKLVLIDKEGRIRGYFDGESPESVAQIVAAAKDLARANDAMTVHDLPAVNATLNGLSAILLGAGFGFIRKKNVPAHRACMITAFVTSVIFLCCYVTYHYFVHFTRFEKPAWFRPIYITILVSHTILAIVIVPLILTTLYRAWRGQFERHRAIARWTWPLWMYVSVTGVIVYMLLYQIFPQR